MSPIVVIGRLHSGSRLIVSLLREVGIFMGADAIPDFQDSLGWYRQFVVRIVDSEFFPIGTGAAKAVAIL